MADIETKSLKLQAYHLLKEKITSCTYSPGSQLNEEQLQNELGMSRTPIRDALSRLEQEGLVTIRSKKGITVTPLSIKELNMTFELRQLLECYALLNYGDLLKEGDLMAFYRAFSAPEGMTEQTYYQQDDAFHGLLVSVVPNLYIARSYEQIINQNTRFRVMTGHRTRQRLEMTNAEHLSILTSCMKRDWDAAAVSMRKHLAAAKDAAFDLLLEQSSGA